MHPETEIYYHYLGLIPEIMISLSCLSSVIILIPFLLYNKHVYLYTSFETLSTHAGFLFLSLVTDPTTNQT